MRDIFQLIRSVVFIFLMYLSLLIIGVFGAPLALASRNWTYKVIKFYCATIRWLLRVLVGMKTEIRGEVPTGDVLIASKHQSFLDIILHAAAVPEVTFVMKREIAWTPIIGFYAKRVGAAPVKRGDKGKAVGQMMKNVQKGGGKSRQLVIYPQGTRVPPGKHLPYKVGAAVLYERMGRPCVPAATNVGVLWGKHSLMRKPGTAVIEYLPTLPAGLTTRDFLRQLEASVEQSSNKLMAEAGFTAPPKDEVQ